MTIWEQLEWRGMARRGTMRNDPFTSLVEINTEPGRDELARRRSRQLWVGPLPVHAWQAVDYGIHWRLESSVGTAITYPYLTADWQACVCFKPFDCRDRSQSGRNTHLFGTVNPSANVATWGFSILGSGGTATLNLHAQENWGTSGDLTLNWAISTLSPSSWYWALAAAAGTTLLVNLWKDGAATPMYSAQVTTFVRPTAAVANAALTVGCDYLGINPVQGAQIAYAACGPVAPSAWQMKPAISGATALDAVFMPVVPGHNTIPAKIRDSTTKAVWRQYPRPGFELASSNTLFPARGFRCRSGRSYSVDLSDKVLFRDRTVMMWHCRWGHHATLLRTYDGLLTIETPYGEASSTNRLEVRVATKDPSQAQQENFGLRQILTGVEAFEGSSLWLAAEFIPNQNATVECINLWKWSSAGGAWSAISTLSTPNLQSGFADIDYSKCVILESVSRTCDLWDWRCVVGDDGWATAHTPSSISLTMPDTLVSWLNLNQSGRFPRDSYCGTRALPQDADLAPRVIAASDRVDGRYRFLVDGYSPRSGWGGAPDVVGGYRPPVSWFGDDVSATVAGITEGYAFEGTTPLAAYQADTKGTRALARVGTHRYAVGPGPLHLVRSRDPTLIGWGRPDLRLEFLTGTTWEDNTIDAKGFLQYATYYRVRLTLYDPLSGSESNPYGPFLFQTGADPGGAGAAYGDSGCSFRIKVRIRTSQVIQGQCIRVYRFHEPTGTYYLEGTVPIGSGVLDYESTESPYYTAQATLALSDDDLATREEIAFDNSSPPLHTYSTIWASRAWYVDALSPSRVWFSKSDRFGSVPGSYQIMTDEGIGGDIIGFAAGFGGLLLLRERSIWVIPQAQDPASFYAEPLIPDIGVVSGGSLVFADGMLWWASPAGIYSWDGSGEPTNHSIRLDGIDRDVWAADPLSTRAYYDPISWRVVFICGGAGISIDTKTGAAALVSAPEDSGSHITSGSANGMVYGHEGGLFRELVAGNKSLTLDATAGMFSGNSGPQTAVAVSAMVGYWNEGVTASGYVLMGLEARGLPVTAYAYAHTTSAVGRAFAVLAEDREAIWARTILAVGALSATPSASSYALMRTVQPISGDYYVDRSPIYYESQDLVLGPRSDMRQYQRLDWAAGTLPGTATADWAVYAQPFGATAELDVSARAAIANDSGGLLELKKQGQKARFVFESSASSDLPEIRSIRLHFVGDRPRGAGR